MEIKDYTAYSAQEIRKLYEDEKNSARRLPHGKVVRIKNRKKNAGMFCMGKELSFDRQD